ncbi:MAG: dihydroorotate dehydrogenase [Candidatus Dormibacteraeota bacterium]|uniref:Dihydroorotate dehydrogenase n=1 Tax=Candidatus Dormiibacter inghamiae TaxID=3127013 RepID=A0A934KFS9_9BACT|nr:dihydroorotate dehydrogenase [Candidatus Dormibacteraeota bacterium]MBJ7606629.1 dihydroorotate dehydrogenase [Candidatus Dormibacteraeota bacterium]
MSGLSVGGVELRSPVLAASGTFGYGTEVPLCDRRRLGGMVSKGIFLQPRPGAPPPRIVETPSGMLNAIGLQGPGVEALIRDYCPLWADWDFPVLVNINGESVAEYAELAARLDGVPGVSGMEVNVSCPNVREGGMFFGKDPAQAAAVTAAVRRSTRLPVWVKLTPAVTDLAEVARACESSGADALCAINTLVGMSIDLSTGRPRLAFGTGGLSGPAIHPIAVHLAHQAAQSVAIPVIGIGGISGAEDALEFLYAGCQAVQVGTATFIDPNAIGKTVEALEALDWRRLVEGTRSTVSAG